MKPPASFGVCTCSHAIYDHARVKPSGNPEFRYVGCRVDSCPCVRWQASDGSAWPRGTAGVVRDAA